MPRPCEICRDSTRLRTVNEMIAAGASNHAIADKIGGISHMSVWRHRRLHVEMPARAIVEAANQGRDAREKRRELVERADKGTLDPTDFLGLASITHDLKAVGARLERVAGAAEQDGQRGAVAQLAGQQIRQSEVRARLGGHGGFAAQKAGAGEPVMFAVNIQFASGERIQVGAASADQPRTIEGGVRSAQTDDPE